VLSAHFKPALLARMTIVPFYPLKPDVLQSITRLKLGKITKRLAETHDIKADIDQAVVEADRRALHGSRNRCPQR
jgi:type VI secretion system protein VasG